MITSKNLDCFVNRLDQIVKLIRRYGVNELSLLQPQYGNKLMLCFVISKKTGLMFDDFMQIKEELNNLLEIEGGAEDVSIDIREDYREEYFGLTFGKSFSIQENVSREAAICFIRENLEFNYTPPASTLVQEEVPVNPVLNDKSSKKLKQVRKEPDSFVETNPFEKKLASSSGVTSSGVSNSSFSFLSPGKGSDASPRNAKSSSTSDLSVATCRQALEDALLNRYKDLLNEYQFRKYQGESEINQAVEEMEEKRRNNTTASQKPPGIVT